MTYDRAIEVTTAAREEFAAVSHGLTSSPPWGEGARRGAGDEHKRRRESLLPLGRRWPEGPDEGAFGPARGDRIEWEATEKVNQVPPQQFGRMTYDRAIEVTNAAREEFAAVSHGLTSSPPWGEGAQRGAGQAERAP